MPRSITRSHPARPLTSRAAAPEIVTLDNGLAVIVCEDHSAPVVSAQAWCKTGSIHEGRWLGAGLSHILEHMLFKGTTQRSGSRIDQEIQAVGGHLNAYTSYDRTVYYVNAPSEGTAVALDVLCDVMQHATLPGPELAKELAVIRREIDMNEDDPSRRSSRRLFETAYTQSPCRFTVIGYADLFDQLTPEDIRTYYRERYVPNNVFLVVVGDVSGPEVVGRIREAYAGNRAKPLSPVVLPAEPRQTAPREVVEQAPIELGHVHLGWHIPDARHPDVPALDVLANLLGGGRSSRLYREVREKRGLVHAVDAWTYTAGHTGLLGLSAVVDADRYAPACAAMLAQVARLQENPVRTRELQKAVRQFVAGALATRKTMQGQAHDLGANWLVADDLGFSEHYLAAVQRVTPRELQRVARAYLGDAGRTVFGLLPRQATPRSRRPASTAIRRPVVKVELDNGLRLLLKEDHRLPFIEFRAVFQGGVLAETPANNGLTWLMSRLLVKGTTRRSAAQIALESESIGGHIDSYGGNNSFGVNAEVLRGDFMTGVDLLADVLLHPTFPATELERERTVQLAGIRAQRDQLLKSASLAMRRALFGEVAYGLDLLGMADSVSRLEVQAVQGFHHQLVRPNNCVLAVVGDINSRQARAALRRAFGRWQPGPGLPPATPSLLPRPAEGSAPRRVREVRDKQQAVLVVGYPGASLRVADRFALELLQESCSDLGSRLFLRIREELGLAYYVGAQNFIGLAPGYFSLYAGTAPDEAARVEIELLQEAEALATEGVTGDELARAKAKLIGQRKIARQDLGNLATTVSLDELYGLGYANFETEDAQYEAVTAEAVRNAARQYLRLDRAVIAIVTPR